MTNLRPTIGAGPSAPRPVRDRDGFDPALLNPAYET